MFIAKYKEKDGIKFFHNDIDENHVDYSAQGLDQLYKAEEKHFWFIARKEFIFKEMKNHIGFSSKIIEIGAGTGNVSRYLQSKGYSNIAVGEMHSNGLKYAKSYGIEQCYQFDLLRAPFEDEFTCICMFDVLEHIENDNLALVNIHKILTDKGHIILTVPAHHWLWSRDDKIAGHKRRYTKKELIDKLEKSGFSIESSKYFFISIVPLLFLRRLLNKDIQNEVTSEELSSEISMTPWINHILLLISRIENKLNILLPNFFGGSLFIIARKK